MYDKIREYVSFKLRSDHSKDHLEKKEEIISNLIERYDELYQKSNDKEFSYIESIKSMGDFIEEDLKEVAYKPEFAELLLVSATILSIISLLATLINSIVGVVIVGISITLYAVGAVYLYQLSKFAESKEYDIQKYHNFLDKTFSYMKTNFTFWALSLSLIITQLIYGMFLTIVSLAVMNNVSLDNLSNMSIEEMFALYFFTILGFLIIFTIIGSLFINTYRKLIKKYSELSGNDNIKSVGMKAKTFLGKSVSNSSNIFVSKWFYPILNGIIILFLIADIGVTTRSYVASLESADNIVVILNSSFVVLYIVITVIYLMNVIKQHLLLPIFNIISSIVFFSFWVIIDDIQLTSSINGPFFFYAGIIFIVILAIDYSINRKIK